MAEKFDPYHKWLGISPKDQPPNYYRLLGIDLYESDPEVISAAAKRAGSFVQKETTGTHAEIAQKLLQRISAVRKLLLDDVGRAAYDAKLRGLASTIVPPPPTAVKASPTAGAPQTPVAKAVSPADAKIARAKPLASVSAVPIGEVAKVTLAPPAPPDAPPMGTVSAKPAKGTIAKVSLAPPVAETPPLDFEAPPMAPISSRSKRKGATAKAGRATTTEEATDNKRGQKKGQKSRPPWMIIGLAGAVIVLVACIAIVVMKKSGGEVAAKGSKAKPAAADPVAEETPTAEPSPVSEEAAAIGDEKQQLAMAAQRNTPAKGAARSKPTPELIQLVLKEADAEELKSMVAGGAAIDDTDAAGCTALRMAVIKDKPELVAALIGLKANVNLGDTWGETPLMSAAQAGNAALVDTLLAAGADVTAATKLAPTGDGGVTALLVAVRHGKAEIVKTLLDKIGDNKEELDRGNFAGVTPLMLAAAAGHADLVTTLIERGANVTARDKSQQTPLMYAAYGGNVAIVKALLKKGATCHAKTPTKVTAVKIAAGRENSEAFDILVRAGEKEAPSVEDLGQ